MLDCQDVVLFVWLRTSVHMLMYCSYFWHMAEFRDTWTFVNRRIKDALDLQKTFQEVAYCELKLHHHIHDLFHHVSCPQPWYQVLTCLNWNHFFFPQAAYLAEAVGAGMGGTVQGVLNRVFQNRSGWTFFFSNT